MWLGVAWKVDLVQTVIIVPDWGMICDLANTKERMGVLKVIKVPGV